MRGGGGGRKKEGGRSGLRCGAPWCVVLFCALLVCLSACASPCLLCSPVLSCVVLSCSLDNMSAVRSFCPSTMVSFFLLLVAVSSTLPDFKVHLFYISSRA